MSAIYPDLGQDARRAALRRWLVENGAEGGLHVNHLTFRSLSPAVTTLLTRVSENGFAALEAATLTLRDGNTTVLCFLADASASDGTDLVE